MRTTKITDREIWDAMETLSAAIKQRARKHIADNPRGADGETLFDLQAETARSASMELSNTITDIFDKYK